MPSILRRTALALAALLAVAAVRCASREAAPPVKADIIVAADGSGRYHSINKALSQAEDGQVIFVKAGFYTEEVEVPADRQNLVLVGAGPGRTVIDADGEYAALTLKGTGTKVSGFTLRGGSSHGLYVPDGHQAIDHCLIYGNKDRGIYISDIYGKGTAEVRHCTIVDNEVSGIYTVADDKSTSFVDCIIAFSERGIVCDRNENNATVENNCLYNTGENLDRIGPGADNIMKDPLFVNRDNRDYHLKPGSPCLKAASDGRNIGCF